MDKYERKVPINRIPVAANPRYRGNNVHKIVLRPVSVVMRSCSSSDVPLCNGVTFEERKRSRRQSVFFGEATVSDAERVEVRCDTPSSEGNQSTIAGKVRGGDVTVNIFKKRLFARGRVVARNVLRL